MSEYSSVYAENTIQTYNDVNYSLTQDLYNYYNVNDDIDLSCVWAVSDVFNKLYYSKAVAMVNNYELAYNERSTSIGLTWLYNLASYANQYVGFQWGAGSVRTTKYRPWNLETRVIRNLNTKNILGTLASISAIKIADGTSRTFTCAEIIEGTSNGEYIVQFEDFNSKLGFSYLNDSGQEVVSRIALGIVMYGDESGSPRAIINNKGITGPYTFNWYRNTGLNYGGSSYTDDKLDYDSAGDIYMHGMPGSCKTDLTDRQDGIYEIANGIYNKITSGPAVNNGRLYISLDLASKIMASCGVYFKYRDVSGAKTIDDRIIAGDVVLGEMLNNGHTTGKWLRTLREIITAANYDKDTENQELDPTGGGGGGSDVEEKPEYGGAAWLGKESVSIDSGMYYRDMTPATLLFFKNIIKKLKNYERAHNTYIENARALNINDDIAAENWTKTFPTPADYTAYIYNRYGYGEDPINSISSLIAYPFDIESGASKAINDIGAEDLYISVPVGIAGTSDIEYKDVIFCESAEVGPVTLLYKYPEITKSSYTFNLVSNIKIKNPKGYTDFRAYAPYTRLELYIPMHGTIDLDPAVVVGQTLTVNVSVTLADGSSVATVLLNDTIYQTVNGQVGYPIPLSAEASSTNQLALTTLSAQSQSQKLNAIGNVIHGLSSIAGSITTGNYGAAAGSAIDTVLSGQQNSINSNAIKYQIEHATDGKIVVGQPSSLNAFLVHPKCQLIWHLPLMQQYDAAIYGKTVGYKCYKTTTLGSLKGYTECSNASLDNVSCTEAEKLMILEQLKNGIIIK